jgi:hypothetical protein
MQGLAALSGLHRARSAPAQSQDDSKVGISTIVDEDTLGGEESKVILPGLRDDLLSQQREHERKARDFEEDQYRVGEASRSIELLDSKVINAMFLLHRSSVRKKTSPKN